MASAFTLVTRPQRPTTAPVPRSALFGAKAADQVVTAAARGLASGRLEFTGLIEGWAGFWETLPDGQKVVTLLHRQPLDTKGAAPVLGYLYGDPRVGKVVVDPCPVFWSATVYLVGRAVAA